MEQLIKDCKNIIMKKIGILCIVLSCILIGMGVLWGNDVVSLCQGAQDISSMEADILENKEAAKIEHAYIQTDVEMIIGSYAEYKKQDDSKREVYYLMPIQDGTYFITIIAKEDDIPIFDEMENYFYYSIGNDEKTYPKAQHITGGFRLLNDEEKTYALDFFTGYDEEITTIDEITKILCPYAIEIDTIGSISIDHLWTILIVWILIAIICIIFVILYASNFFLKTIYKDIEDVSDTYKKALDKDYKEAKEVYDTKFGELMFYKKESYTIRIYRYEQIIWLYKKEILDKNKRNIQVYAYDITGKQFILYQSTKDIEAEKYLQILFDHCKHAILGYQEYLYETWVKNPRQLPVKIKELQDMQKQTKKIEDSEKKEEASIKKRRVLKEKQKKKEEKKQET